MTTASVMLTRLAGRGVKGRDFDIDLTRPTLVIGPNDSGKTSRIIAASLALRNPPRVVPSELGDRPEDCGAVDVAATLSTSYGGAVVSRRLGSRHLPHVDRGGEIETKPKAVEAIIAEMCGVARAAPVSVVAFLALSEDAQRALVCDVAGATLDARGIEALRLRLVTLAMDAEDARGRPRAMIVGDDAAFAVAVAAREGGLVAAKEMAAERRKAAQRDKLAAEKARARLAELAFDDVPPGHVEERAAELRAAQERVTRAREQLAARAADLRERERLDAAVREAGSEVERCRAELAGLPAALADPEDAAAELARAEAYAAAAATAHEADERALHVAETELHAIARAAAEIEERGKCPSCGMSGAALGAALAALRTRERVAASRVRRAAAKSEASSRALDEMPGVADLRSKIAADARARDAAAAIGARLAAADARRLTARDALAALPAVEGVADLEAERDAATADAERLRGEVERLTRAQENARQRAENEADLDAALEERARWAAVLAELSRTETDLVGSAYGRVEAVADELVVPTYGGAARWRFRPRGEGDAAAWGFGLEIGGGWRPYGALSDSGQIVCGLALHYAITRLAGRPFRPIVLDRLEAIGTGRAVALMGALAVAHASGLVSCVLGAMKTDEHTDRAALRAACEAANVALIDLTPSAVSEAAPVACAAAPKKEEEKQQDDAKWGRRAVACRKTRQRMQIAAHRARECDCGAELLDATAVSMAVDGADDEALEWAVDTLSSYALAQHMRAQAKERGGPEAEAAGESRQAAAAAARCRAEIDRRARDSAPRADSALRGALRGTGGADDDSR